MIYGMNLFTSLNGQNLLGNHRQHLQINTVELVKTRPGTARCQTLEKIKTIQLCSYTFTNIWNPSNRKSHEKKLQTLSKMI